MWKTRELVEGRAAEIENTRIASRARLPRAEAAFLVGDREKAVEWAAAAPKWLPVSGQLESERRDCLRVAAAGLYRSAMVKQARQALDRLNELGPPQIGWIIVSGPTFAECANNCTHWRQ